MLTVDEALSEVLAHASILPPERVSLEAAAGRILAADIVAPIDQPPFRASAMDGYAVRFANAAEGARLRVVGESAAGRPFKGAMRAGEAVRVFTGGVVPEGADHIVIQEEARADGAEVIVATAHGKRAHVRDAGIDFSAGSVLKCRGDRLSGIDVALIASANIGVVEVVKRPEVAFFDNGDELREPGAALKEGEIVGSTRFAMTELFAGWGGTSRYLGRAPDDRAEISKRFGAAQGADVVVAVGGASVGEHDHMRAAFEDAGGRMIFTKVSVKPGKPTWFGRLGETRALGLPGNPASAVVCSMLFLKPLIAALLGETTQRGFTKALLASALDRNGPRESYLRGTISVDDRALLSVRAFPDQDSSLLSPLAEGNCLIRRPADAPPANAGELVDCLLFAPRRSGVAR